MSRPIRGGAASLLWGVVVLAGGCASAPPAAAPAGDPAPRVVAAGAPGEASRVVEGMQPVDAARPRHTAADAAFMQGMIAHHLQAVEMTALVAERTQRADVRLLARRIEGSQADEIAQMRRWLEQRGEVVPDDHAHHRMHGAPGGHAAHGAMPGMLTPEEMARLAAARDAEFDRLFLEGMIRHHEGALVMVAELFETPGAGQEVEIFQFASHVDSDQRIEIARMRRMLAAGG
jgi:uncharacterized protein (DUF305 family)